MTRYIYKIALLLLVMPLAVGCQPESSDKLEQEITSLQNDIKQLKQDVADIGSQVKDIHVIATKSQKPQFKTLPTQANFDDNGQIPSMGEDKAQLAIIEFSDYQCPYCKRFIDQTFTKLKENYIDTGKVKYLTRDFPLGFHPKAKGAAVAANCSLQQGAYWPMREALFNNMKMLDDELYKKTASDLSLDITKFTECLADPQALSKVEQDMALGSSLGIRGTPSFVVGRIENNQLISPKLVVGAQNYNTFAELLDELMVKEDEK